MIYEALVLRVDEDIEEEVLLRIGGIELACFASVCPYDIEVGLSYPVELHPMVFDKYSVNEVPDGTPPSIDRVGTGFVYVITGKLSGGRLKSGGLVIEDEVLERDFSYLEGKMIALNIDRMDVEFLSR